MNPYKLQTIMEHVRRQGRLPTDRFGNVLSPDDLMVWFELNLVLSFDEQLVVRRELANVTEMEAFEDRLRLKAS